MAAKTTKPDTCKAEGCMKPRHVYKSGRVDRSLCTQHGAMWKDGFRITHRGREAFALKTGGAVAMKKTPRAAATKGYRKGTTVKDGVVVESPAASEHKAPAPEPKAHQRGASTDLPTPRVTSAP